MCFIFKDYVLKVLKMKKVLILKNQNHSRARFVYVFGKSGITGTSSHPLNAIS